MDESGDVGGIGNLEEGVAAEGGQIQLVCTAYGVPAPEVGIVVISILQIYVRNALYLTFHTQLNI